MLQLENQKKEIFYEIHINNEWKEFFIISENVQLQGINDIILYKELNELENTVFGKYFKGCIGYNPNGWWEYIRVDKTKLRYKQ